MWSSTLIDDWGLGTLTEIQRQDLLEVMEDRDGMRSTVITSQLPREDWLIAALMGTSPGCTRPAGKQALLSGPVDTNASVRFFYVPPLNYFHPPLLLRAVGEKDPRLNTAPIFDEGRTVYISLADMRKVIRSLTTSLSSWPMSRGVELPGPSGGPRPREDLEVVIFLSTGTARTLITPGTLCATLAPGDAAVSNRALWEFQLFRVQDHCTVPGFDRDAFPEHDSGER